MLPAQRTTPSTWFPPLLYLHLLFSHSLIVRTCFVFVLLLLLLLLELMLQMLCALCWCYPNALAVSVSVSWYIFADIIPLAMPMPHSPQGNHFALTEQITNFVIFRSFHFVSFALTLADGGIPEAAAPACLLLFVPVLLLLKSGFSFCVGWVLYTTLHIYPASLFVFSRVCLCFCVCLCVCTKLNAQLST